MICHFLSMRGPGRGRGRGLFLLFVTILCKSSLAESGSRGGWVAPPPPRALTMSRLPAASIHTARKDEPRLISSSADIALLECRGGACQDSTPALMAKISVSAVVQTAAMVGVLRLAEKMTKSGESPKVLGVSLVEAVACAAIIFASSAFGSLVDGGLSAASRQVLEPTVIPSGGEENWYANLKRPSWEPPGFVFPIMWLIVSKPTQLLAVTKVMQSDVVPWNILTVYCFHLSLGDAWNKVFFGLQCAGRGAAVITAFYGVLLLTAYLFSTVDPTAGLFMLPTSAWVTIATLLNWNIYLNN